METCVAEELSDQQRLFVLAYLDSNCNTTEAARRAGYADPNNNGWRIRRVPAVAAEIKRLLDERAMPVEEGLSRLAEQARNEVMRYLCLDKRGKPSLDLKRLQADGKEHLITGLVPTKYGLKIEWADPQAALRDVLRHHGAFNDKLAVTTDEDALDAAIERGLAQLAGRPEASLPPADRGATPEPAGG